MRRNENYVDYDNEKRPIPWDRLFLSLLGIVLVILLVLLFMKFCGKKSLQPDLLKAGKEYYEKYPSNLPNEVGTCNTVSLKQLEEADLIKAKKYSDCNLENTYVKVCYLESKNYHYTAILACDSETTKFGMWKDGTEKDLIADKSDVRFRYLGEQLRLGTKYYYPNDNTNLENVKEYYADSPKEGYTEKEDEQIGYKWYTEVSTKEFYNNGAYTSIQPKGYPTKGQSKLVTNYTLTQPNAASYRVVENITLYRTKVEARQYKWQCISKNNPGLTMISDTICAARDDEFTTLKADYAEYTCDGVKSVERGTVCSNYTDWTDKACQSSKITGVVCESQIGYKYTDTQWQWYKSGTGRKYYPSGSDTADKETTYYLNAPVNGAIKDETTKQTVYKFYKLVDDKENANLEEWVNITGGYITEADMITAFQKLGYSVQTLRDINRIDDIRYQLQLQYRNIEE